MIVQYRELIERYEKELAQLKKPQANLTFSKQCKGCKKRTLSIEQEPMVQYKQPVYASLYSQGDKL